MVCELCHKKIDWPEEGDPDFRDLKTIMWGDIEGFAKDALVVCDDCRSQIIYIGSEPVLALRSVAEILKQRDGRR
jgi:hypothetical protein